jgi:hypothetical protein
MAPGRAPDPVWASHFKRNPDTSDTKKPYVDLYEGKTHSDNATRAKLFLAFKSPMFMNTRQLQWIGVVSSLTSENIKACKPEDKATWELCRTAQLKRTTTVASGGSAAGPAPKDHMPSAIVAAGAYGSSITCAGFPAAELHLRVSGRQFLNKSVDSISREEVDKVNELLFRLMTRMGWPLSAFDSTFWNDVVRALRPAAEGLTLTADMIRCVRATAVRRGNALSGFPALGFRLLARPTPDARPLMRRCLCHRRNGLIRKAFGDTVAAVKEIEDKAAGFAVQIDGWTDGNGDYLMQIIKVISGYAFYDCQPTSQGERCDAAWTIEQCEKALSDSKCVGLTGDNCTVMQDTKKEFLLLAEKLKHVVFYANCQWHGGDSIGAALIGEGGAHCAEHVLEHTTGPEADRWTMNTTKSSSIPAACKSIVKMVKRRHRLKGFFNKLQGKENKAAITQWKEACVAAKAVGTPKPLRPRKFPMLSLPGKTRKLSITNTLATVLKNEDLLDDLVRSAHFVRAQLRARRGAHAPP